MQWANGIAVTYLLCSGRSSADANQKEWLKRMHLGKEAVGK